MTDYDWWRDPRRFIRETRMKLAWLLSELGRRIGDDGGQG